MTFHRKSLVVAMSLMATMALAACNQPEPTATPPTGAPSTTAAMPPMAQSSPNAPMTQPYPNTPMSGGTSMPPASAQVTVASVDLGSAVGADKKVTQASTSFSPKDTIYASVATTGTGNATLDAKWTFQDGQTVKEDSKTISPTGPANTTFSISKPDGWPTGSYKVEITLNGNPVATKDFAVK